MVLAYLGLSSVSGLLRPLNGLAGAIIDFAIATSIIAHLPTVCGVQIPLNGMIPSVSGTYGK